MNKMIRSDSIDANNASSVSDVDYVSLKKMHDDMVCKVDCLTAELDDIRHKYTLATAECVKLKQELMQNNCGNKARTHNSGSTITTSSGQTSSSSSHSSSSSSGQTSSSSGDVTSSEESDGFECDCASRAHSIMFNTLEWCVRLHPAVGCELADIVDANGDPVFVPNSCARMMLGRVTQAAHAEQKRAIALMASVAAPEDAGMYDFSEIKLSSINSQTPLYLAMLEAQRMLAAFKRGVSPLSNVVMDESTRREIRSVVELLDRDVDRSTHVPMVRDGQHVPPRVVDGDRSTRYGQNTGSGFRGRSVRDIDRGRSILERDRSMRRDRDRSMRDRDRSMRDRDGSTLDRDRSMLDRDRSMLDRDRSMLDRDMDRNRDVKNRTPREDCRHNVSTYRMPDNRKRERPVSHCYS